MTATVVGWIRPGLDPEARRRLGDRMAREGFRVEERRFTGSKWPAEEFPDELIAIHDLAGRRLVLWFHDARGVLFKRLRSAPTREAVAPLFEPEFDWRYERDGDRARVEVRYGPGAPAEGLGDRIVGLHDVLAKVDRKSLLRWVDKFLNVESS